MPFCTRREQDLGVNMLDETHLENISILNRRQALEQSRCKEREEAFADLALLRSFNETAHELNSSGCDVALVNCRRCNRLRKRGERLRDSSLVHGLRSRRDSLEDVRHHCEEYRICVK